MKEGRAYTVKQLVERTGMSRASVERALLKLGAESVAGFWPQRWYLGAEPNGMLAVVSDDFGLPEVSDDQILPSAGGLQVLSAELMKVANHMKAEIKAEDARTAAAVWMKLADVIDSRPDWREYLDKPAHTE
jgi:hypothetical protein